MSHGASVRRPPRVRAVERERRRCRDDRRRNGGARAQDVAGADVPFFAGPARSNLGDPDGPAAGFFQNDAEGEAELPLENNGFLGAVPGRPLGRGPPRRSVFLRELDLSREGRTGPLEGFRRRDAGDARRLRLGFGAGAGGGASSASIAASIAFASRRNAAASASRSSDVAAARSMRSRDGQTLAAGPCFAWQA